jgi:hypothetical protein
MASRGITSVGDVSFRAKPREVGDTSLRGVDEMGRAAGGQAAMAQAQTEQDRMAGGESRALGMEARGAQTDAMGMARARATGQAPSIAAMAGARDQAALARQQGSMAASARGPAAMALAQQNAAGNASQGMAQISQSSQIAEAQERQAAESAYAAQAQGLRGADMSQRGQDQQSQAMSQQRGLGYAGLQLGVSQADMQGRVAGEQMRTQAAMNADQINAGINMRNAANERDWLEKGIGAGANAAGGLLSLSDARAKEPLLSDVIGKEAPTFDALAPGGGMDVMGSLKKHSDFATKNMKQGGTAGASPMAGLMLSDAKTKAGAEAKGFRKGVLASVVEPNVNAEGSPFPAWGKGDAEKANAAYQAKAEVTPPNPDTDMATDDDLAMRRSMDFREMQDHFNATPTAETAKLPGVTGDTSRMSMADIDAARKRSQVAEAAGGGAPAKSDDPWAKIGAGIGNLFKSDARAKEPMISDVIGKQAHWADNIQATSLLGSDPEKVRVTPQGFAYEQQDETPNSYFSKPVPKFGFRKDSAGATGEEGVAGKPAAAPAKAKRSERKPTLSEAEKWADAELSSTAAKTESAKKQKSYTEQLAESARALESAPYAYKPEFTPPDQRPGEMNVGPMAQNLAIDPLASSAVKKTEDGMLALDRDKLLKLNSAQIANLQKQLDERKK